MQSNYRLWRRYIVVVHAVTGKVVLNRHRGLEMEAKKTEPQRENGIGWKDKDAKRPVGWLCQWWVQTTVVMTKELSRNRELQAISIFGVASQRRQTLRCNPATTSHYNNEPHCNLPSLSPWFPFLLCLSCSILAIRLYRCCW